MYCPVAPGGWRPAPISSPRRSRRRCGLFSSPPANELRSIGANGSPSQLAGIFHHASRAVAVRPGAANFGNQTRRERAVSAVPRMRDPCDAESNSRKRDRGRSLQMQGGGYAQGGQVRAGILAAFGDRAW
jgi:hypothetical protein